MQTREKTMSPDLETITIKNRLVIITLAPQHIDMIEG